MPLPLRLYLTLVRVDALPPGAGPEACRWTREADASPAASNAQDAHNRAIAYRLAEAFPGLEPGPRDDRGETEAVLEEGVPAETMIRRFHRSLLLVGPWLEQGEMRLWLYDGMAQLELPMLPRSPAEQAAMMPTLAAAIASIAEATGFTPWLQGPRTAAEAAALLVQRTGKSLARAGIQARRQAMLARFGLPSAALLGLLALALSGFFLAGAFESGAEVATADATRPAPFVVHERLVPERWMLVGRRYALAGQVGNQLLRLPVARETWLRAFPGGALAVLPTRVAARPWVPQTAYERAGPVLPLGQEGGVVLLGLLIAPLPLGLWGWLVLRPLRRARGIMAERQRAGATRALLAVLGLGALVAGVLALT